MKRKADQLSNKIELEAKRLKRTQDSSVQASTEEVIQDHEVTLSSQDRVASALPPVVTLQWIEQLLSLSDDNMANSLQQMLAQQENNDTTVSSTTTTVTTSTGSNVQQLLLPIRKKRLNRPLAESQTGPRFTCGRGHNSVTKNLLLNDLDSVEMFCCPHPDCKDYSHSQRNGKVAENRHEIGTCCNNHVFLLRKVMQSSKRCPFQNCKKAMRQQCLNCNNFFNVDSFSKHKCNQ